MANSIPILLLCSLQLFCGYNAKAVLDTYEGKSIKIGRADPLDVKIFEASITSSNGKYLFDYPAERYYGDQINYLTIDSTEDLNLRIVKGAINSRFITLLLQSKTKNEFEAKISLTGAFILRDFSIELHEELEQAESQNFNHVQLTGIGKADPLDVKIYEETVHSKNGKVVFDYGSEEEYGNLVTYLTVDCDTDLSSNIVKGGINQRFLSIELESQDGREFEATVTLIGAFILRTSLPIFAEPKETNPTAFAGKFIEIGRADKYDVEIYKESLSSNDDSVVFRYPIEGEYGDVINYVSIESENNLRVRIQRGGVGERFIEFELESADEREFEVAVSLVGAFLLRSN